MKITRIRWSQIRISMFKYEFRRARRSLPIFAYLEISQFSLFSHVFTLIRIPRILHGNAFFLPDSPAPKTLFIHQISSTTGREELHFFRKCVKHAFFRQESFFSLSTRGHFTPAPPAPPTMLKKITSRGEGSSLR